MSDAVLALGALGVLCAGLGGAVLVRALGLARTYVRDLVHVGTGVWVLSWPMWRSAAPPIMITLAAAAATLAAPRLFRDALSDREETWSGVALYVFVYAAFTAFAFLDAPFPAAGALLALSLGDGVGGAIGRRFGAHFFTAPGGKRKSLEGSLTVLAMSVLAVLVASWCTGARSSLPVALGAGVVAALAEAIAPRGTDNAVLPVAVWLFLRAV